MFYRIYTEAVPREDIERILLSRQINSFSMTYTNGYWQGKPEMSSIIEVLDHEGNLEGQIYAAAEEMRALMSQDVVYVAKMEYLALRALESQGAKV